MYKLSARLASVNCGILGRVGLRARLAYGHGWLMGTVGFWVWLLLHTREQSLAPINKQYCVTFFEIRQSDDERVFLGFSFSAVFSQ